MYEELAVYTLSLGDREFVHQYVVDAFAAQNAGPETKPIAIAFALAGLFLHLQRGYTGKEVQNAHMELAKVKHRLPRFDLPDHRGSLTAEDVLAAADRLRAIDEWSASVWNAYSGSHERVRAWLKVELGV